MNFIQFTQFIWSSPDIALYSFLAACILGFALLELLLMITVGMSILDAIGGLFNVDITLPDFFLPKSQGVPFSIWLACIFVGFTISGLASNALIYGALNYTIPLLISAPLSLIMGALFARFISAIFVAIPLENSSAIDIEELKGSTGSLTFIRATEQGPAEAKVVDKHGQTHYVRVRPTPGEESLELNERILLIAVENGVWFATKL